MSLDMKKIIAGVAAVGLTVAASTSMAAGDKKDMEKCYGVVKAGKNDCGNSKHSCAGQAKTDGAKDEWVSMPKGLCNKLVNGSTEPGDSGS